MNYQTINSRRGYKLATIIDGSLSSSPVLIIAHGMLSSKDSPRHIYFMQEAIKLGLSVVRFDFAGLGDSEGTWRDLTLQGEIDDLLGVIDYVQANSSMPIALYGSSLGGGVALRAAGMRQVAAVATWAAVCRFDQLSLLKNPAGLKYWEQHGEIAFQGSKLSWEFARQALTEGDFKLPDCPCFLAHGSADEIVPVASAREMAQKLPCCEYHELEGADHQLLEPISRREELIRQMAAWVAEKCGRREK